MPETMQRLIDLKFISRYQKNRPPFIAKIFETYMCDRTTFSSNKLYIALDEFLKAHKHLFRRINKNFRFQLLFHNFVPHWTACDVFVEKDGPNITSVNLFLIDAATYTPGYLRNPIANAFYAHFGDQVIHYLLDDTHSIQKDNHNCGTFALDHAAQISLLNPESLYGENLPLNISTSRRGESLNIYGRDPMTTGFWCFLEIHSLPLPLLRNIQAQSDIEELRMRRRSELNLPVYRNPRPWNLHDSVTRGFNDYINVREIYREDTYRTCRTNTAIDHKYEQYMNNLDTGHPDIDALHEERWTFEQKFRIVYFEENMGLRRDIERPEGYYEDRWR